MIGVTSSCEHFIPSGALVGTLTCCSVCLQSFQARFHSLGASYVVSLCSNSQADMMSSWCNTHLTLALPTGHRQPCLDALVFMAMRSPLSSKLRCVSRSYTATSFQLHLSAATTTARCCILSPKLNSYLLCMHRASGEASALRANSREENEVSNFLRVLASSSRLPTPLSEYLVDALSHSTTIYARSHPTVTNRRHHCTKHSISPHGC